MVPVRTRMSATVATAGLLVAAAILAGCAQQAVVGAASSDGGGLVESKCGRCHPLERVRAAKKDKAGWTATVERMTTHGLQVTAAQKAAIIAYLSTSNAP